MVARAMSREIRQLLLTTARAVSRYNRAQTTELNVSPVHSMALLAIDEDPGQTVGALAARLDLKQSRTSMLVDALIEADLVRRETDPQDRRRAQLYIADSAKEMVKDLSRARETTEKLIQETLSVDEAARFMRVLEKLYARLSEETGEIEGDPPADNYVL